VASVNWSDAAMIRSHSPHDAPLSKGISVIVPVYNSEGTLADLVSRLETVLDGHGSYFEVILVNDGSRDSSWDVLQALAATHQRVVAINLMRNYGQHNAILCGMREARYDVVVTLDDDLQNPPEEIPKLLSKLDEGFDVVYGTPEREQHGFWRDAASQITKLALQGAMGAQTASKISAFRTFRTRLRDAFHDYDGSFVSIDVLLTWATTKFTALPAKHESRLVGKSNYDFRKLVTHAMNMVTGFSIRPLQLASLLGFVFTAFGFALLAYVLISYVVRGSQVQGFAFLASAIAIFSGVQLFVLGIIGEYLARMHFKMMQRPTYAIGDRIASDEPNG